MTRASIRKGLRRSPEPVPEHRATFSRFSGATRAPSVPAAVFKIVVLAAAFAAAALQPASTAASTPRSCELVFVESTGAALFGIGRLVFDFHYSPGKLAFGTDPVACAVHPSQVGTVGTFTADDVAGTLRVDLARTNGLLLEPLAVCTPRGSADAESSTLLVTLVSAQDLQGKPMSPAPVVSVETFECTDVTSTTLPTSTTTLPSVSTTTLAVTTTTSHVTTTTIHVTTTTLPPALCGDADGNGDVTAADALLTLRRAVGAAACPLERCDTDGNGTVTAVDAYRILRAAVGIAQSLHCW